MAPVGFVVGPLAPGAAVNLANAPVASDVSRPQPENRVGVVRYFLRSVAADAAVDGSAKMAALLARLRGYEGRRAVMEAGEGQRVAGPMLFRKGQKRLAPFTTIATFGNDAGRDATGAVDSFRRMRGRGRCSGGDG